MKQRYIPLEKRSKREQKECHTSKRGNWGDVNPVTRKTPNLKAYNRKKSERWFEHEPHSDFLFSRYSLKGSTTPSKRFLLLNLF